MLALFEGNPPRTGESPSQRAINAESVSMYNVIISCHIISYHITEKSTWSLCWWQSTCRQLIIKVCGTYNKYCFVSVFFVFVLFCFSREYSFFYKYITNLFLLRFYGSSESLTIRVLKPTILWYLGQAADALNPSGARSSATLILSMQDQLVLAFHLIMRHDDVIKWKHFPRYWPFVRGIHRSPLNSPHKGQWRGALMFSLNCARINGWVNKRAAGDLRRYHAHYDVIVMGTMGSCFTRNFFPLPARWKYLQIIETAFLCVLTWIQYDNGHLSRQKKTPQPTQIRHL